MALFKPKWMSKNPERRKAAVAKITDQEKLAAIIYECMFQDTQLQAAQQLTDPFQIKKCAEGLSKVNSRNRVVKILDALAEKVYDPMLLLELADRYRNEPLTQYSNKWIDRAIESGDEEAITRCILRGYRKEQLKQLLTKLSSSQRVEVAKKTSNPEVIYEAIYGISDTSILRDLAADNELDDHVRVITIERLFDLGKKESARQALISWLRISRHPSIDIIKHLSNTELLMELGAICEDPKACIDIYEKLPGKVAGIIPNMNKLLCGKKDERWTAAVNLIELMSKDEMSAKMFWSHLKRAKGTGHSDSIKKGVHKDTGPSFTYKGVDIYRDCNVNEKRDVHSDAGMDVKIPPYPFDG